MLAVVLELANAPAVHLFPRAPHRVRDGIRVQHDPAVDVARRPARRLDQRAVGAKEALLVGVEDRDQRHLGQVEPLAEEVDADQGVELAEA